jgi:hypothetical protein
MFQLNGPADYSDPIKGTRFEALFSRVTILVMVLQRFRIQKEWGSFVGQNRDARNEAKMWSIWGQGQGVVVWARTNSRERVKRAI